MVDYNTERTRIAKRINTETARVAFIFSNYILAALMSEAGVPWWITGAHVIANAALTGVILKRYHDGNTAFDEMRELEAKIHR